MRRQPVLSAVALLLVSAVSGGAAENAAWGIVRGDVRVICPLTVGGTFEAKTASLSGTLTPGSARPAAFVGALAVDLRTLVTGIGLRDEHMRNEYLEVGKGAGFDTAVLSDIDLGGVAAESVHGRTRFTAALLLHGVKKAVAGQADVRRDGTTARVDATFPVTLADYGIAEPRYLGIGVKDVVQVKVSLAAAPEPPAASR